MIKRLLFSIIRITSLWIISFSIISGQASIQGKVIDKEIGEGLIAAEVTLYKKDVFITGTTTDFDGNYVFTGIEPGVYTLVASYIGYETSRVTGVVLYEGKVVKINLTMSEGVLLDQVVVKAYRAPLIHQDNTTQGKVVTSEQIRSMPTKSIGVIAAKSKRMKTTNKSTDISVRGSRSNAQNMYVDGIRVSASSIPNGNHKQNQAVQLSTHNPQRIHPDDPNRHFHHHSDHEHPDRTIDNEQYGQFVENSFVDPMTEALSTFAVDVDRAGYSNIRRFIDNGMLPPTDAVRIEEMINYFHYDYPQPEGNDPIALHSTLTSCPWNSDHQLMHIGLQGKEIPTENLPASNMVFLIDVSGSMNNVNKLPLLKSSFKMLINNLRSEDRVAIVTYAGSAGVALESTSASDKEKIINVVNSLGAGGSTAGAEGILTAYKIAKDNFIKDGNNRIILATDGDFNVGASSNDALEKLIEKERKSGVFLSVLGFGMGNYKDEKMQTLADKGNGNHAYIDNIQEARKVLVSEFGGTLFTIAKDVKLQIEFNPAHVQSYRLVGYENRLLAKEDFNDDTKDAGEMGSGHVVTAIYEIITVGSKSSFKSSVDPLRYQGSKTRPSSKHNDELATIKFRYKTPKGAKSKMIENVISPKEKSIESCNDDIRFSLAVAQFGLLLRQSAYSEDASFEKVISLASKAKGKDEEGYRAEFIRLAKSFSEMQGAIAKRD